MQKPTPGHEQRESSELATRPSQHRSERGATSVEYAIIVSLIAGLIVGIVTSLGIQTAALFGTWAAPW
jgi:Flp pilus assembly pilin Flp